jgi:3',5'-cyclic AMP phosphodiesterase CpdA
MRVAHFSDLHLLDLTGVPPRRFLNKRLTGWVNLRFKRGSVHRSQYAAAVAREIARSDFDHVVVTGDLTNLALEPEFERAVTLLREDLGMAPARVTVVPGNHDVYTRGSMVARRFERYMEPWLASDLPDPLGRIGPGHYPVVKIRGRAAFIGLSSAVPRPPLVAAGQIGQTQLEALRVILAHPDVASRTPVFVLHHPLVHPWSRLKAHTEGLRDAGALASLVGGLPNALVLHGHLHRRIQREVATPSGHLLQAGATSASLHHLDADRMCGFNVYEFDDSTASAGSIGHARVHAMVYRPEADAFRVDTVPKHVGWNGEQAS